MKRGPLINRNKPLFQDNFTNPLKTEYLRPEIVHPGDEGLAPRKRLDDPPTTVFVFPVFRVNIDITEGGLPRKPALPYLPQESLFGFTTDISGGKCVDRGHHVINQEIAWGTILRDCFSLFVEVDFDFSFFDKKLKLGLVGVITVESVMLFGDYGKALLFCNNLDIDYQYRYKYFEIPLLHHNKHYLANLYQHIDNNIP